MNGETGDLWERGFLGDDVRQIETEGKALRGSSLGFSGSYRKSATYKTAKNVKLDEEDLTVTDDTVLEEHNEDPSLVQMRLIGDGVVDSIMRGEVVGITPRRSRSSAILTQHQQHSIGSIGFKRLRLFLVRDKKIPSSRSPGYHYHPGNYGMQL
ncbi:hypothetical protein RUM43_007387 [Polyplax serrata]|uniref:Lysine-specific demethylase 3A/B tudor domain-containing protein n=1 Tax=Polyplax serrata TaxID=468196 RepID=A0AAN8PMI7_POLSC